MSFRKQLKHKKAEVLADAEKLCSSEAMWRWKIGSIITWHKLLDDWGRPDLKYKITTNPGSPLDDIKVTSNPDLFILDNYRDLLETTIAGLDRFKRYISRLEMEAREKDEEIRRLRANGSGQIQWVKT